MELTEFTFITSKHISYNLNNVPLFETMTQRDRYFDSIVTTDPKNVYRFSQKFNFRYDRGVVRVPKRYDFIQNYTGGYFYDPFNKKRYYFNIIDYKYLNDKVTELNILINPLMTFCMKDFYDKLGLVNVKRKTLTISEMNMYKDIIRNNSDNFITPKKMVYSTIKQEKFDKLDVLIVSSVDLNADYGDVDDPKIESSLGTSINGSLIYNNLYLAKSTNDMYKFLGEIKKFPWIAQNINNIYILPEILTQKMVSYKKKATKYDYLSQLEDVTINEVNLGNLTITNDDFNKLQSNPYNELYMNHVLTSLDMTDFSGSSVEVDVTAIDKANGFKVMSTGVIGRSPKIRVYPYDLNNNLTNKKYLGDTVNNMLEITNFDTSDVIIDNVKLGWAKGSFEREQTTSKFTNRRLQNAFDFKNGEHWTSRLNNALMAFQKINFSSIDSILDSATGIYTEEAEYWRELKLKQKENAFQPPTIKEGEQNNLLNAKMGIYGITVRFKRASDQDLALNRLYHKSMGFEVNTLMENPNVRTMTNCDYIQLDNYVCTTLSIEKPFIDSITSLLHLGVTLWHDLDAMKKNDKINNIHR